MEKNITFSVDDFGSVHYKYTASSGVKFDGIIFEPKNDLNSFVYIVFSTLIDYYRRTHDHEDNDYPMCDYIAYIKDKSYTINPKLVELVQLNPKFKLILIESVLQEKYNIIFDYGLDKKERYKLPTIEFVYKKFSGASSYCDCCGYHNYESKELLINEECVLDDWTDNHMRSGVNSQKVGEVLIKELEKLQFADFKIEDNTPREVLTLLDNAFTIHRNHEYYGDYDEYLHHSVFKYSQYILDVLFPKLVQTTFEIKHECEDDDDDPYYDFDDDDD